MTENWWAYFQIPPETCFWIFLCIREATPASSCCAIWFARANWTRTWRRGSWPTPALLSNSRRWNCSKSSRSHAIFFLYGLTGFVFDKKGHFRGKKNTTETGTFLNAQEVLSLKVADDKDKVFANAVVLAYANLLRKTCAEGSNFNVPCSADLMTNWRKTYFTKMTGLWFSSENGMFFYVVITASSRHVEVEITTTTWTERTLCNRDDNTEKLHWMH